MAEITALNRIRRQHPALHSHLGLEFYTAHNDQIILYGKRDPIDRSMVLVAVSFDPHIAQEAVIEVPRGRSAVISGWGSPACRMRQQSRSRI